MSGFILIVSSPPKSVHQHLKDSLKDSHLTTSATRSQRKSRKIDVFLTDLDRQIDTGFNKMRSHTIIKGVPFLQKKTVRVPTDNDSRKSANNDKHIQTVQAKRTRLKQVPSHRYTASSDHITLMNNNDVKSYVQLVYNTYPIRNPLKDSESQGTSTPAGLKSTERQPNSTSTKQSEGYDQVECKEFNLTERGENPSKYRLKLRATHKKGPFKNNHEHYQKSAKQPQNVTPTKQSQCQGVSKSTVLKQIRQVFRYCLMCEESVLEDNLIAHEFLCQPFRKTIGADISPFLRILNCKINRISAEISEELIHRQEDTVMREVALIRSCANRLVDNLRNNRLDEAEQIDRWRASYRELNDSFLNSFIPCCSKLAKLDWFVRLRANMAKNLSASI